MIETFRHEMVAHTLTPEDTAKYQCETETEAKNSREISHSARRPGAPPNTPKQLGAAAASLLRIDNTRQRRAMAARSTTRIFVGFAVYSELIDG